MSRTVAPEDFKLEDFLEAQRRIKGQAVRTPLLLLNQDSKSSMEGEVFLKLENLQPIGSFKVRGALNAIKCLSSAELSEGIYTASAGNFSQGLAWATGKLGIKCHVLMPDHASDTKVKASQLLGASVTKVTFDTWWEVIQKRSYPGMSGKFIHPVCDKTVIAGNGTTGLEIVEDLPEVDSIIVPYGGGALSSGIALAVKALRPATKVFASEVETAAPFHAALTAGEPVPCSYVPSFVDGIGSKNVLDEMWPLASQVLDGSIVVSLEEVADAVKLLVERNRVVAEGAGAAAVAAALTGKAGSGKVVAVISGGNIDTSNLLQILQGQVPK